LFFQLIDDLIDFFKVKNEYEVATIQVEIQSVLYSVKGSIGVHSGFYDAQGKKELDMHHLILYSSKWIFN